jgi:VIT1/CCC1 family predicted Fe2+/Mn2+ transporter
MTSAMDEPTRLTVALNDDPDHVHYGHRAAVLRAAVLGATDGLVSVGSLLFGLVAQAHRLYIMAGVSGLVGGALSMAVGEYVPKSNIGLVVRRGKYPEVKPV